MEEIRREIRVFNKQPRRSSREERGAKEGNKSLFDRSSNVSIALMRKQCKKENSIKDEEEKQSASKKPSDLRKKVKGGRRPSCADLSFLHRTWIE